MSSRVFVKVSDTKVRIKKINLPISGYYPKQDYHQAEKKLISISAYSRVTFTFLNM
jgi:hypothetical protein